jgi:hypothetical protein
MQGIYTYIPETSHVPREYNVAAIIIIIINVVIIIVDIALSVLYLLPVPVAARSKVYGPSPAAIVDSNLTGGMDVCLLCVLCVAR